MFCYLFVCFCRYIYVYAFLFVFLLGLIISTAVTLTVKHLFVSIIIVGLSPVYLGHCGMIALLCVSVCLPGWDGAGLGAQQQGIEEPIKAGDVRGNLDKYKVHSPHTHP